MQITRVLEIERFWDYVVQAQADGALFVKIKGQYPTKHLIKFTVQWPTYLGN